MLNRSIVERRIASLMRQEDMLIAAMQNWPTESPARQRLAARFAEVQAQLAALQWATGDYTWPPYRSEARTKRLIRKEYDHA